MGHAVTRWLASYCIGMVVRASMKICMPPHRRLLSWHAGRRTGVVVRWRILAGCGPGRGPAIVPGTESSLARERMRPKFWP